MFMRMFGLVLALGVICTFIFARAQEPYAEPTNDLYKVCKQGCADYYGPSAGSIHMGEVMCEALCNEGFADNKVKSEFDKLSLPVPGLDSPSNAPSSAIREQQINTNQTRSRSNAGVCRAQRNTCRDTAEDQEFSCFTRCNIDYPFGSSACKEDCRIIRQSSNAQCDAQQQSCLNGNPPSATTIESTGPTTSRQSTNASIEPILGELEELAVSANEAASFSNPSGADGRPCITLAKMPDSYQSSKGREVVQFSNSCPMIMYVEYSANVSSLDEGGLEIQPNGEKGVTCDGVCRISNVRWKIAQWHYE